MRRRLLTILAVVPLLAFSCEEGPAAPGDGLVEARFENASLVVTNHAPTAFYYIAINPRTLALWALCTNPTACPSIEPGATVRIPTDEIGGWSGDPDASVAEVHYYRLSRRAGGDYEAVSRGVATARR